MTDRGTRVRWTTAALVAPTAAALFTGSTVWAVGHQPVTAAKPVAATPAAAPAVDPVVVALRAEIDANSARIDKLRATVEALKAQATAIARGASVAVPSSGRKAASGTRTSTSRTSSSRATSTASRTTAPRTTTVHVSTPAPPPATSTTTGASGAVK